MPAVIFLSIDLGGVLSMIHRNFRKYSGVARIVDRRAERQIDAPRLQLVGNVAGIGDGARQPIQLRHDKRVPFTHGGEGLVQTRAGPVAAGQPVVSIDPIRGDTEIFERLLLRRQVLPVSRAARVSG